MYNKYGDIMDYSKKIIALREQFHLNDIQFSEVLNTPVFEVRNWQNGVQKPSIDALKRFYDVFGVTKEMLFNNNVKCTSYAMKIKINKNYTLFDSINSYYGQWRTCALKKKMNLYILNPIVSLLYYITSPFEALGDTVVNSAVYEYKSRRNYVDYLDYLIEDGNHAVLVNYKKGYAFFQPLKKIPKRRKFKFNGRIYKKMGYKI